MMQEIITYTIITISIIRASYLIYKSLEPLFVSGKPIKCTGACIANCKIKNTKYSRLDKHKYIKAIKPLNSSQKQQ